MDQKYIFMVQYYDAPASLIRTYRFTYYSIDNTIQMVSQLHQYDIKQKKVFLKRCQYPSVTIKDLYLGSVITIFSRQLKIVKFADQFTKNKFEIHRGKYPIFIRTYAMIKPDCYLQIGKIINIIQMNNFTIGNLKMFKFTPQQAETFYQQHNGKPFYQELIKFMSSDLSVGLQLVSDNSVQKWRQILGHTNPQVAKKQNPTSIRAIFGSENSQNACHGSDSSISANRQIDLIFGQKPIVRTSALFNNCSCLVIKPHAVLDKRVGEIFNRVLQQGFQISAAQMFWLDRPTAQQFLQVYKGVVPEFAQMANQLTIGPCIALQVRQENFIRQNNVVQSLRELCGPHDPDLARTVRKNSLRALYGIDKIRNAVHCTDLAEDGILQVEYFFNILQK